MRTGLCVGGSLDGQVKSADGPRLIVPLRIPLNAAEWLMHPETRATQEVEHKRDEYLYDEIRSGGQDPICVWHHSSMTMREAIARVFAAYSENGK